jgi:hypothetical protein
VDETAKPPDTPRTAPSAEIPSIPITIDSGARLPVVPQRESLAERRPLMRPSEDTLLSAPVPADRAEMELEDRLTDLTTRLAALETRLRRLELDLLPGTGTNKTPGWIWIAFLLVLALIAALFSRGK